MTASGSAGARLPFPFLYSPFHDDERHGLHGERHGRHRARSPDRCNSCNLVASFVENPTHTHT
jgi:hypothetical protein